MIAQLKIEDDGFPEDAETCPKCGARAVINMDGCLVCLSCGAAHNRQDET